MKTTKSLKTTTRLLDLLGNVIWTTFAFSTAFSLAAFAGLSLTLAVGCGVVASNVYQSLRS